MVGGLVPYGYRPSLKREPKTSQEFARRFFASPGPQLIMQTLDCMSIIAVLVLISVTLSGCLNAPSAGENEIPVIPTLSSAPEVPGMQGNAGEGIALTETRAERPLSFVPGGAYNEGDVILLEGTTILSPGNHILIEISPVSFGPTKKSERRVSFGTSGVVSVGKGEADSRNTWAFIIDTKGWEPDEYLVQVSGIEVPKFTLSSRFTIREYQSTR